MARPDKTNGDTRWGWRLQGGELLRSRRQPLERRLHHRWIVERDRPPSPAGCVMRPSTPTPRDPAARQRGLRVVGFKGTYGLMSTEGILAGEAPPDDMVRWFSHPATTRRVADAAIVVDALKQSNATASTRFAQELDVNKTPARRRDDELQGRRRHGRGVRQGIGHRCNAGHTMTETVVPFAGPTTGLRHIERDRQAISHALFGELDVVLLPTTTTTVPLTTAAETPQSLSSENTVFANYYGLPAMSGTMRLRSERAACLPADRGEALRIWTS